MPLSPPTPTPILGQRSLRGSGRHIFLLQPVCQATSPCSPMKRLHEHDMPSAVQDGAAALLGHQHDLPPCETPSGRLRLLVFFLLLNLPNKNLCAA